MAYSLKHGPQPLLPQIAETFSLSPARASLVVASEMMGMSVMLLIVIVASEFMDRKKITGFSLLAAGALALAQAASPSFGLIVGLRFAQGMLLGTPVPQQQWMAEVLGMTAEDGYSGED